MIRNGVQIAFAALMLSVAFFALCAGAYLVTGIAAGLMR